MNMYRAKLTFCGKVNMVRGEVRDIPEDVASDLVKAGYIEDMEAKQKKAEKTTTAKRSSKNAE